jgi:hypothetical protein
MFERGMNTRAGKAGEKVEQISEKKKRTEEKIEVWYLACDKCRVRRLLTEIL